MCRSKAAGGHRCNSPSHSPESRKLGRVAFRLYGTSTAATREAVTHLNPEYVNGSVADRRRIGRAAIDQIVMELAAKTHQGPGGTALPSFPAAPIPGLDYMLEVDDILLKRKADMDDGFAKGKPARYAEWSESTGIEVAELERLADQRATEMAAAPIAIQVYKQDLQSILTYGVLNQFQTGDSSAHNKPWKRIDIEWLMLGVDPATLPEDRPRYGFLKIPGYALHDYDGYGDVELVLNDRVKGRATFCAGDSWNETYYARPCSFNTPHGDAITSHSVRSLPPHLYDYTGDAVINFYCEVQIHGTVTADDIAYVRGPKSIRKMVEARGLRWEPAE